MEYDSKTLSQYKKDDDIGRYLSDKYKKTVLAINIKNALSVRNELSDDSMVELIEHIVENAFKGDIFLKIFAVTNCEPMLFLVIDKAYEIVKTIADRILEKYFLNCNIFINVLKYV